MQFSRMAAGLVVLAACTDSVGPRPTPAVPRELAIPLSAIVAPAAASPTTLMRIEDGSTPPEYLVPAAVTGFTEVDFAGSNATAHGEQSFYGNYSALNTTLAVSKNGSTLGSQTFARTMDFSWGLPMGWSLSVDGLIPAPSCGGTASGTSSHTAKIIGVKLIPISEDTRSSSATPRTQSACDTGGEGGGGIPGGSSTSEEISSDGTLLIICTTTYYYSSGGAYLYSTKSCRTEPLNAT